MSLKRSEGCLLGLACGDAVGATVEFVPRGRFPPLTDMVGGGKFRLALGEWTDDTSMALCLADSLLACKGFNPADQMARYWRWGEGGYRSVRPHPIGMGKNVVQAMRRWRKAGEPYSGSPDPKASGNGCLMRLAPVPIFYQGDLEAAIHYGRLSAATTHGSEDCLAATGLFAELLVRALGSTPSKAKLLAGPFTAPLSPAIQAVAEGSYREKGEAAIKGSGWVVESLEAALWCFWHGEDLEDTILRAANLGDDADTTAAIAGQLAGAYYGADAIPRPWRERLALGDEIAALAQHLAEGAHDTTEHRGL